MNKQPLFILTLCFILGILFQDQFLLNKVSVCFSIGGCSVILIILFFHSYILGKIKPFLLGLLFFGLGIIFHFFNTFSPDPRFVLNKKEPVVFEISQKLNSTEKFRKYEGIAESGNKRFTTIVYVPRSIDELDFKHYYRAEAYMGKVKTPPYDFQFDYARYLKRKNIEYQCHLSKEIESAEKLHLSFADKLRQQRLEILQKMGHSVMSEQTQAFLKGIILADRTEIDEEILQDFNRSGLIHFLAISGTHIIVIFGMFYFVLIRLIPLRFRKYAIILSLGFIWLFAAFIGYGNSVLRSCIMLSVYFIYVLLQRKSDVLHSLALSAFIILIFDTQQIFDIGFQLSCVAVLGIFWLNQPLLRLFPKRNHYLKKLLFNTISISIAAQLATLPLVLYYFHQFSFISFIANIVIVPFSELIIVFSFLMTVFVAFQINFSVADISYDFVIRILLKGIHEFAGIDALYIENISMNILEILSVWGIIYFLRFLILKCNFKNCMRLSMGVMLFLLVRTGSDIFESQRDELVVLNFYKSRILGVKNGNKVCFWISDITDQKKMIRYFINPYCSSRRLDYFEIKTLPSEVQKVVFQGRIYDLK
ncbi:ComEC/Rec2 family competence protein [Chryseobacterium sp.]|uniref:ComEC/Rec2 family competence protein n=1 Tax=Chryseobacterium sp. TaxID=1871047 RepID=UPI0025C4566D|nr:ComEC/Rec2 family competence protein [Chryseobacterium sp.]MBV8328125.1 ComEC/Rec2 family competence protein [Chryseobacterium sp.]